MRSKREHERALELMRATDEDQNGQLNFREFLVLMGKFRDDSLHESLAYERKFARESGFSSAEVSEFRDIFADWDEDQSGELSSGEVETMIASVFSADKKRLPQIYKGIRKFFADFDADRSGAIDFPECLAMMRCLLDANWNGIKAASAEAARQVKTSQVAAMASSSDLVVQLGLASPGDLLVCTSLKGEELLRREMKPSERVLDVCAELCRRYWPKTKTSALKVVNNNGRLLSEEALVMRIQDALSGEVPIPGLEANSPVSTSLCDFLLQQWKSGTAGTTCGDPPAGYNFIGPLLCHAKTGVLCWPKCLDRRTRPGHQLVLFHYTGEAAFNNITGGNLFASGSQSWSLFTDCDWGPGVYCTAKAPDHFDSKLEILYNNFPRSTWLNGAPMLPSDSRDFPSEDRVAYCIPMITNIEDTPALPMTEPDGPLGPIQEEEDFLGLCGFDTTIHDIWLVSAQRTKRRVNDSSKLVNAIHTAAKRGQLEIIDQLLASSISIDATTADESHTPLMTATLEGTRDVVEALLDRRACVNACDTQGDSSLMKAAGNGDLDMVRLLVSVRASTEGNKRGLTPLDIAKQNRSVDSNAVVALLSGIC